MTDRNILINDLNSLFSQFWSDRDIDLNNSKIPTNKYNACMMYIYDNYINKLELYNPKGFKQYSYIDYINIVEWYISKSLEYDFISLYGLSLLINRDISWLYTVKNNSDDILNMFIFDIDTNNSVDNNSIDNNSNVVLKTISSGYNNSINSPVSLNTDIEKATAHTQSATQKVFQYIQQATVNKLNDSTIGLVTNANNNKDIGLMYAKERIQEQTKARLTIALNDLPKLE